MNRERRLIITIIGAATLLSLLTIAVLGGLGREVPEVLETVAVGGLALLAPSPLSKSATPER